MPGIKGEEDEQPARRRAKANDVSGVYSMMPHS